MKETFMPAGDLFEKYIITMDIKIVLFTSEIPLLPNNINSKQFADYITCV